MESEQYGSERDEKGKFLPGNKQGAGRGSNKVSTKVRESIVNFLENNVDSIQASFDELKAKEKLEFISSILAYAAPKLSAIEADVNANHSGGITISWEDPKLPDTEDKGSS